VAGARGGSRRRPLEVCRSLLYLAPFRRRCIDAAANINREEALPSFDVTAECDLQEVRNAADQANREIETRFDFKGVEARFELVDGAIMLHAEQEFQLQQMLDILRQKLSKRKVDLAALDEEEPVSTLNAARQRIGLKQGIDSDTAKRMVKAIKASKIKVQAQIQGEQLRVTGKKRDDLQQTIALLKAEDWKLPLQFTNFRD
jgi:uncharacterized protein YajQ (UPF0234 family)